MGEEVFYRSNEVARQPRALPADAYGLIHRLFRRAPADCLFVPIRSMQYLAVIDAEEIIFTDGAGDRSIEIAWQDFRPQARSALTDPVAYQAVYYTQDAAQTMLRLQGEFRRALIDLERKRDDGPAAPGVYGTARIVKLSRGDS
ncbi:MAG: hypothetical protein ACYDDO_01995 [Acidiferrobacterales bacterium]